ncbi:ADP-ribosylglycohydrolase family protein [Adlercreutzia sp. ZJ141]|uniref:ADP-ribosylglycohydrolase family protein n=1 Tax=Adlercreutzia sp. ZJ141 TaxID=2709406 RepID=UPI0013EBAD2E|nr:ADP-ribosylglycohydrolase family protein [Adlercreutzia sp. ZJ141]
MYGAIIGDIAGSRYEFYPEKTKDMPLFAKGSRFTDDTVLTVAVANALLEARKTGVSFKELLVPEMRRMALAYPDAGYGGRFATWLGSADPSPYGSFGNGSAMRVSPCGLIAVTLEEALDLARASAEVTHDHPEGIKGAQAVAGAVFLAKTGHTKEEIRAFVQDGYYNLDFTLDEIRAGYGFDETCQGSVPQAIVAFLEAESYEDAIRGAISLGGDADTQAAIAGSIAWSYYRFRLGGENLPESSSKPGIRWPQWCQDMVEKNGINAFLPADFVDTIKRLDKVWMQ